MKKIAVSNTIRKQTAITEISEMIAEKVDTSIYRIISGEYKLRNDGELDMRFKENKKMKDGNKKIQHQRI